MGCLAGCLALLFPRLALFCIWLFGPDAYLSEPFPHVAWPLAGFLFLPTTTLAFAFASNSIGTPGDVSDFGWLLVVVGLLLDAGLIGGGHRRWARSRTRSGRDNGEN